MLRQSLNKTTFDMNLMIFLTFNATVLALFDFSVDFGFLTEREEDFLY